ncbi:hypothetical protein OG497_19025 [Streptomyces sp. NBC_01242]|uniref:hypothetical protein n=1 Tax=Streptomyces sp. NBC_01242 TaxID=2903795 RepID=UPI0022594CA5|nr:hypothetical protein [Streptomyces sp. NBC_01242]MCX4796139.1 hypothetical protein [Streptomyces sp. NBC_01242]
MIRILFKETVPPEDFENFAQNQSWKLVEHFPETPEQEEEFVWETSSGIDIHRVHNRTMGLSYTVIEGGPEETRVRDVVISFESAFSLYSHTEVLEMYRTSSFWDEKVLTMPMVALSAPHNFNEETFNTILSSFEDSHENVRYAGVVATYYVPWKEFIPPLLLVTQNDPDADIRMAANDAVANLRRHNA